MPITSLSSGPSLPAKRPLSWPVASKCHPRHFFSSCHTSLLRKFKKEIEKGRGEIGHGTYSAPPLLIAFAYLMFHHQRIEEEGGGGKGRERGGKGRLDLRPGNPIFPVRTVTEDSPTGFRLAGRRPPHPLRRPAAAGGVLLPKQAFPPCATTPGSPRCHSSWLMCPRAGQNMPY